MEQQGYVIEVKNGVAKIRVNRESACGGNCVSCKGCPSSAIIIEAKDEIGLKRGDSVTLYEDSSKVIKYAVIGYGLLAALMCVGAVIGYNATGRDLMGLLGAALGLAIGVAAVKLFFRNVESDFKIKGINRPSETQNIETDDDN